MNNIGLGYRRAPNRRQAIIWTNDGLFYWLIMRHSASLLKMLDTFNLV